MLGFVQLSLHEMRGHHDTARGCVCEQTEKRAYGALQFRVSHLDTGSWSRKHRPKACCGACNVEGAGFKSSTRTDGGSARPRKSQALAFALGQRCGRAL